MALYLSSATSEMSSREGNAVMSVSFGSKMSEKRCPLYCLHLLTSQGSHQWSSFHFN